MQRLPGFDAKANGLIELLTDYDWTGRVTSKGHWLGKAPDGKTTITVPSKMDNPSRAEANAKATFKRWVRDAFPDIATALDAAGDEDDPILHEVILLEGAHRKVTEVAIEQIVKSQERDIKELLGAIDWPVRTPWIAHKASNSKGGVRYESEAVLQRLWENGDVDFECAFEGPQGACGYHSDNPRGVAVHYGKAHTMKGQVEPAAQDKGLTVDPSYTEPLLSRDYNPTGRLVTALWRCSRAAEWAWHRSGEGRRDSALDALRPDIEHTERAQRAEVGCGHPVRDQEARRTGHGGGLWRAVRAELGQAESERDAAVAQRDAANAQLVRVERDLNSLKELLEGIGK